MGSKFFLANLKMKQNLFGVKYLFQKLYSRFKLPNKTDFVNVITIKCLFAKYNSI